jgi:hypothetical protein
MMIRLLNSINAFHDNEKDFQSHLASTGCFETARRLGVRMRAVNKVTPKVRCLTAASM